MRTPAEWFWDSCPKTDGELEEWTARIADIQAEAFAAGRKAGLAEAAD